eukprot:gb/GEZN01004192.1/.p1 GENE.gb/GEZN01004192.1/~~gb/GEZN01004192.1/.p1  ORF type:complete len:563 (-),score=37.63 gb/GEZN01004192.1/:280-1968(-)
MLPPILRTRVYGSFDTPTLELPPKRGCTLGKTLLVLVALCVVRLLFSSPQTVLEAQSESPASSNELGVKSTSTEAGVKSTRNEPGVKNRKRAMFRFAVKRHTRIPSRVNANFFTIRHQLSAAQLARFDPRTSDWDSPSASSNWDAGWLPNNQTMPWDPWYWPAKTTPLGTDMELVAYSLQLSLGNPPQKVTVVMDTGSGNLEVNGAECSTCETILRYDPSVSRTAMPVPCDLDEDCACVPQARCYCNSRICSFDILFADQTGRQAHLVEDIVRLAGFQVSTSIGVIYEQIGSFGTDYDGTMGFAYGSRLMARGRSWMDDLARTQGIDKVFSLCMGIHGGQLAVGGLDPSLYLGDVVYTPVVNTGFYTVILNSIQIRTSQGLTWTVPIKKDPYSFSGTIIDTGSTIMHFSPDVFDPLVEGLTAMCKQSGEGWVGICDERSNRTNNVFTKPSEKQCVALPRERMLEWPTLVFKFQPMWQQPDADTVLEPHHYLYPLTLGPGTNKTDATPDHNFWCLGFSRGSEHSGINLGDTFIRAVYLVHDLVNMRMGFAQPNKENCGPQGVY